MKTSLKLLTPIALILLLSACSSVTKTEKLREEAKNYSQTKSIYCGASAVKTFYADKFFISVSCDDGSSKFIDLEK